MAAAIISGAGLESYYAEREAFAPRPAPVPGLDRLPVSTLEDGSCELRLAVDGLRCASCVWVTEKVLERTPGVREATLSYGSGRARVVFDPAVVDVGGIAGRIAALGYLPRPLGSPRIDAQDRDLLVRLGVAAFCAMNVMMISAGVYAGWWSGMDERFAALFRWASLAIATPAAVWSAAPFFEGAWQGLKNRVLHMDLPVSLGIAVLYGTAVVATVLGHDAYLDSLTMLVALLLGGRVLEARGRRHARDAAESLAAALPRVARRVTADGGVETVSVDLLRAGDRLDLGAGEEIGADGIVESGEGLVRMALLTGESEPAPVRAGDRVHAGAIVADGNLRVRVEATGGQTLLERMAEDLRNAADRPATTSLPDRIAPWFTGATLIVSALTFGLWTWLAGWESAVAPTVAVLVVACPCALALAQPLAVASGLGAAARRGLLLRSGDALMRLGEVDTVVLDKTGTLTGGEPVVVEADDAILRVAAGIERWSVHPIARAIVDEAIRRGIPLPDGRDVREVAGEGISGTVDGRRWIVRSAGVGVVEVRSDGTIGLVRLRDTVRPDAARTVAQLVEMGLRVVLLSGDHPAVAARVAKEAGVPEVGAGVDPLGKAAWVEQRKAEGGRVLFAGDGLNDGPALAAADVAVAMGSGAASSVLVADGVVAEGAVGPILAGLRAGRVARSAIRANLVRSVLYNATAVTLAAFGFVNPLVAAVLMPLSSGLVVWGALKIERKVVAQEASWTR
jgi:Cu2+-exporting ATPase